MSSPDEEIRHQLASHGDDGKAPRHTLWYFYGGDIEALRKAALSRNFVVRRATASPGLILEKTLPVDDVGFAPISASMGDWADKFGAEYDGWECAVVRN